MQTQFQYIVKLAEQYQEYSDKPASLYKAINNLPESIVQDIFNEYGDPEKKFQPVNLLRAEISRLLLNGLEPDRA